MTVSRADVLALWPAEELVLHLSVDLYPLGLPAGVARILTEVGLPVAAEPFFFADESVTTISGPGRDVLWRIGSDGGAGVAGHAPSGVVLSGVDTTEVMTRFVNSSLDAFASSLCEATGHYRRIAGLPDDEVDALVRELKQRLAEIDGKALAEPDNWWAVLVEQLEDGLL